VLSRLRWCRTSVDAAPTWLRGGGGTLQHLRQRHNCDAGSALVAQRHFRRALIAQPEKFDAPRRLFRFCRGCDSNKLDIGVQTEQLSLMQIQKSGRAARTGAFGEHLCLLSGGISICWMNPTLVGPGCTWSK